MMWLAHLLLAQPDVADVAIEAVKQVADTPSNTGTAVTATIGALGGAALLKAIVPVLRRVDAFLKRIAPDKEEMLRDGTRAEIMKQTEIMATMTALLTQIAAQLTQNSAAQAEVAQHLVLMRKEIEETRKDVQRVESATARAA